MRHAKMFQDRPYAGCHRMNNRHAEIVLGFDDIDDAPPAGAQEIDSVNVAMWQKGGFDMAVDLFAGQVIAPVKIDRYPQHRRHVETGSPKIIGEFVVDGALIRRQAEKAPNAHRAQRFAVAHTCGHDGNTVLLRPTLHQLFFRLVTANHKWRAALRMNQIDADLRQLAHPLMVNFHGPQVFVLGVLARADKKRYDPDAVR